MRRIALIAILILNAGIANAIPDTASWASWGGTTTGTFTQNGSLITFTYTDESDSITTSGNIFDVPSSFTSPAVTYAPVSNDTISMTGGNDSINNLHFSQAVIDPLIVLWSVGQPNLPVTFNFRDHPSFSILSQGPGHWGVLDSSLVQNGYSVTGLEGNGLLQFHGTFTDLISQRRITSTTMVSQLGHLLQQYQNLKLML